MSAPAGKLRQVLLAQLANFDDDAFVALANRGLLRRAQKDLEKQAVELVAETDAVLELAFGEHLVRFDARGPAHATCSCPAGGVCQHILAAALSLQREAPAAAQSPAPAAADPAAESAMAETTAAPSTDDPLAPLGAALLAIPHAELVKHAGRAGYRWAWQFVQDLDLESDVSFGGERNIVIGFRHPRVTFRYMGGATDALIADVDSTHTAKQRVAAVLAWRRAHGIENPVPEKNEKAAALDLGRDHALPDAGPQAQQDSRVRLFAAGASLMQDCIELGLSHLSSSMHERFSTLAVWSQGADCYRLALLLRRIADHIEALLERSGAADEHRLFDEITLAYGLVAAMEAAAAKGSIPRHLAGMSRTRYEEGAAMELVGVGAYPWRTHSGYVGLTMLFWSERDRAFLSCSDARPETQRGFNPIARYTAPGPWSGMGAPSMAGGRLVRLSNPQVNELGRLSGTEKTSADFRTADDLHARLIACTDWEALMQERGNARRSLLAQPDPMRDWVALAPEHSGPAQFDVNRQTLVWPLFDAAGRRIDVELAYSDYAEHAIGRIEQLAQANWLPGTLLIAQLRDDATGLKAFPLSLVRPKGNAMPFDALHFDKAPGDNMLSRWLGKLREGKSKPLPETVQTNASRHLLPVQELRHWLQRQAERGVPGERRHAVIQELALHLERLDMNGFSPVGKLVNMELPCSFVLMRLHYLCMQYEKFGNPGFDTGESG